MEADELYTVKCQFHLSNFTAAIEEARGLKLRGDAAKERDCYIYRALIGAGNAQAVLAEIRDGDRAVPTALRALRLFAQFVAEPASRSRVVLTLEDWLDDATDGADGVVQLVAAQVALHEGKWAAALKALRTASPASLEHAALTVQALLGLDRLDLAEKTVKAMQTVDDEAPLTCLSSAIVSLALGGDRIKEAAITYKDLLDRFGSSIVVLNGLATAYIASKRLDDAEKTLGEALKLDEEAPETLVNLVALMSQRGRERERAAYLDTLRRVAPDHPYIKSLALVEGMFDRVAASLSTGGGSAGGGGSGATAAGAGRA